MAVGVRWRNDRARLVGEGGNDRDRERGLVCRAQLRRAPCDERYIIRVRSRCLRKGDRSPLLHTAIFPPSFAVRIIVARLLTRQKARKSSSRCKGTGSVLSARVSLSEN